MKDTAAIRGADDLVVIEDDRLMVRRGGTPVAVLPSEVRYLVDGWAEAAAKRADQKTQE